MNILSFTNGAGEYIKCLKTQIDCCLSLCSALFGVSIVPGSFKLNIIVTYSGPDDRPYKFIFTLIVSVKILLPGF